MRAPRPLLLICLLVACQGQRSLPDAEGGFATPIDGATTTSVDGAAAADVPAASEPDAAPDQAAAPDRAATPDRAPDQSADPTDLDACQPGCHYDCFGGLTCHQGKVYSNAFAPRSCCHPEEHQGDPLVCVPNPGVSFACPSGTCGGPLEQRYASCLRGGGTAPGVVPGHLLRLACAEGRVHQVGDACQADDDCRPAAEGARLRCDAGHCVSRARPAPPPRYGGSCGLTAVQGPEDLMPGKTCDLCYVPGYPGQRCQACTIACQLDEDCPEGSVCLCARSYGLTAPVVQFCAPLAESKPDERMASFVKLAPGWLACP